ncbi:MAG: hypothetical protein Q9225_004788 [Loekoesia sp. 1 TL-2023]
MLVFSNLQRGLGAFLMLCVSALLLFGFELFLQSTDGVVESTVERQIRGDIQGYNISTEYFKNTAIPFGNQSYASTFSPNDRHRELRKRAFEFNYYVCKGGNQWRKLQEASDHTSPSGPIFSDEDLQDGWSKDDTDQQQIMSWIRPLEELVGRKPVRSDTKYIKLRQDKAFRNAAGDLVQETLKESMYFVTYLPSFSTIIASNTKSPSYQLRKKYPGPLQLTRDDIAKRVPKLNRFSDVIWKVWTQLVPNDPEKLRYVARDFIVNDVTVDIMNHIFGAKYRGEKNFPWPGLTFGLDSDEGKALLASPNGIGVYWLLLDRAAKLGRRKLKVTIFSGTEGAYYYCMLWDLNPA